MAIGLKDACPRERQVMEWRAKPYGTRDSAYAVFKAVEQYRLGDVVSGSDADHDHRPGRRTVLARPVPAPLRRAARPQDAVPFTKAEGADPLHCEPMAQALLEQRMFDWLDEALGTHGRAAPQAGPQPDTRGLVVHDLGQCDDPGRSDGSAASASEHHPGLPCRDPAGAMGDECQPAPACGPAGSCKGLAAR